MAKLICLESHLNLNLYPRLKLTPGGSLYGWRKFLWKWSVCDSSLQGGTARISSEKFKCDANRCEQMLIWGSVAHSLTRKDVNRCRCRIQCSFVYPYPSVSDLAGGNSDHGLRKTRTKTQTTPDSVSIGERRNSDHGLSFWGGETQTMVWVWGLFGVGVDEGALKDVCGWEKPGNGALDICKVLQVCRDERLNQRLFSLTVVELFCLQLSLLL